MRATRISMIALTAALSLGLAGAAHSDGLVLKRDSGVKPRIAATTTTNSPAVGATNLATPTKTDLVIEPYYNNPNGLPEGFPTESFCVQNPAGGAAKEIKFYIRNTGNAPTGFHLWRIDVPSSNWSIIHNEKPIPPGQKMLITQGLPYNCYTPGSPGICQFSFEIDYTNKHKETNEGNNKVKTLCVGPSN